MERVGEFVEPDRHHLHRLTAYPDRARLENKAPVLEAKRDRDSLTSRFSCAARRSENTPLRNLSLAARNPEPSAREDTLQNSCGARKLFWNAER